MDNILATIQDTIREVLDQPDLTITRHSNAQDVEGWDSLSHLYIISALEDRFAVKFKLAEIASLRSVGQLADLIAAKQQG